jgi:hypothetical protein
MVISKLVSLDVDPNTFNHEFPSSSFLGLQADLNVGAFVVQWTDCIALPNPVCKGLLENDRDFFV